MKFRSEVRVILASMVLASFVSHVTADITSVASPAKLPTTRASTTAAASFDLAVDFSEAPELEGFAKRVEAALRESYPKIVKALPSQGFAPPARISVVFRKDFKGVAECEGDRITGSVDYFKSHPDDVGAFVHELTHVVQQYGSNSQPGWLTEGIADYVRFYLYEPASQRPHPDPAKAKYDDSYRTSAAFLDWAQRQYDLKLIEHLNAACRTGRYSDELWKQFTGVALPELGAAWRASLPTAAK